MTVSTEVQAPVGRSCPSVPPKPEEAGDVATRLEGCVQAGVARVLEAFEHKLAYDAAKQRQIDLLHEELQQHRSDAISRASRPLVHGVIRLHDDIGKLVASLREKAHAELSPERFLALLEGLQEDVELVLSQNGIAAFRETGNALDLRRQRVLRKVPTSDSSLADKVAESLRPGFEQRGEVLEKERVAAYAFEAAPTPTKNQEC